MQIVKELAVKELAVKELAVKKAAVKKMAIRKLCGAGENLYSGWVMKKRMAGAITPILTVSTAVFLAVVFSVSAAVATEETENEPLRLQDGAAEVRGTTAAQYQLTRLAGRDRHRKLCLGYGTQQPDHTLVLSETQPRLRVAVDSDGGDTTLLIQGPRGIDCNDNARRNLRDAAVNAGAWPEGTYQIWVGSFNRGDRLDYTLRVTELPVPERK